MCAVIKRGILGGFSNKIGNIVGTSWKGIAVMKSLPLSVANPRTAGQVTQREAFGAVSKLGSVLLAGIIKPLWDRFAQQESGFNAFLKSNIEFWIGSAINNLNDLIISKGKMVAVTPTLATLNDPTKQVIVSWPTALPDAFSQSTDLAYVVITTGEDIYTVVSGGLVARSAGTLTFNYPGADFGSSYWCFLAFKRVDGTVVSDTGNLEVTII